MNERQKMNSKPVLTLPVKSVINFQSGFADKLLCDGPSFSAGTSCSYTCSYCFVPAIMAKNANVVEAKKHGHTHEGTVIRRKDAVEIVRQQLTNKDGSPKFDDPKDNRVIYASPLVDVAANMELVNETVEICKLILSLTNWHIRLLSKSNLLPKIAQALSASDHGSYTSDFERHGYTARVIYGVSTGTLDDKLAKAIEPDCPLVSKRIESLHWLQDNGYRTFGMICPSIPPINANGYEELSNQMAHALRYDRCEHIWAEVMNVRGESMTRTAKALRDAGFERHATELERVSTNKLEWEEYARETHRLHAQYFPVNMLRFLQYVDKSNIDYWRGEVSNGAVLLGKAAHG